LCLLLPIARPPRSTLLPYTTLFRSLALRVLGRIWTEAWDEEGGMSHVIGRTEPRGLLEDNVHAAAAFLDAFEATGDEAWRTRAIDRKSTRLNSSHQIISYAVFCLKK